MSEKLVLTEFMSALIHEARLNKGMKLNEVCDYVGNGLDESKLSRIENYKCKYIRVDHIKKLNELFGLALRDNYDIETSLLERLNEQRADIISLQNEIKTLKQFIYDQFGYQLGHKQVVVEGEKEE